MQKPSSIFSRNPWVVRAITIAIAALVLWPVIRWAFLDATFLGITSDECSAANDGGGACWPAVWANINVLLFSHYPRDLLWRPIVALLVMAGAIVYTLTPRRWSLGKGLMALVAFFLPTLLLHGIEGTPLKVVPFHYWGGFVLSMVLGVYGVLFAFPLGLLLALGRRSSLPIVKTASTLWIELIRGVPLITLLFMANFVLPLFLPATMPAPNPLIRAQVAMTIFGAAYIAEVIRGGLQALPTGQYEAASSLALSYWKTMGLIILPQALRISIPPLISTFIGLIKDTSLVSIIGLFDLLGAAREVPSNPAWIGRDLEILAAAGLIYWLVCIVLARYGKWLENKVSYLTA